MPEELLNWMDQEADQLHTLFHLRKPVNRLRLGGTEAPPTTVAEAQAACKQFVTCLLNRKAELQSLCVANDARTALLLELDSEGTGTDTAGGESPFIQMKSLGDRRLANALVTGFEQASKSGPVCEEPVRWDQAPQRIHT
eukprot:Protomagalhaensia_sp_Gyna_25__4489@NODE_411_length_3520_cov_4_601264_g317_i0_p4_GENE_NODE_411_length_3520_cov_4_601264_g317_i0NODE_411_length_3520_cov_4_601264_g317_i0_p4_ORF_typecomplete_len140_score27_97APG6/PF04111_12/0_01EFG_IV/PF03764_18/0_018_NODE_411_length_3520_cov_4_601264_g317_i020932512